MSSSIMQLIFCLTQSGNIGDLSRLGEKQPNLPNGLSAVGSLEGHCRDNLWLLKNRCSNILSNSGNIFFRVLTAQHQKRKEAAEGKSG